MKIIVIGATGYIGSGIVNEALIRGHQVTAVSRKQIQTNGHDNLRSVALDIFDQDKLTKLISEHDVVISAFSGFGHTAHVEDAKQQHITGIKNIIAASKVAKVSRLLLVGGAGSLKVASGADLVDTDTFPEEWKENAKSTRDALTLLRSEKDLAWTFLSPSALIAPGDRTGHFRLGKDDLLVDEHGDSKISIEDYAYAMLDEVEKPNHHQKRFTVGY